MEHLGAVFLGGDYGVGGWRKVHMGNLKGLLGVICLNTCSSVLKEKPSLLPVWIFLFYGKIILNCMWEIVFFLGAFFHGKENQLATWGNLSPTFWRIFRPYRGGKAIRVDWIIDKTGLIGKISWKSGFLFPYRLRHCLGGDDVIGHEFLTADARTLLIGGRTRQTDRGRGVAEVHSWVFIRYSEIMIGSCGFTTVVIGWGFARAFCENHWFSNRVCVWEHLTKVYHPKLLLSV